MNCEKCQDRGFTEEDNGLLMVLCDCEAGEKKREELGMPPLVKEVSDDNTTDGAAEPDDKPTGSGYTSKPRKPSKQKAKRATAEKSK